MTLFTQMLRDGSTDQRLSDYKLRYALADACLAHFDQEEAGGRDIYSALSHLAMVPELQINMAHYDNLLFVDNGLLNPNVYYVAVGKLHELNALILSLGVDYEKSVYADTAV